MNTDKNITIKIEGEIGKYQTIPIDYLIDLSKELQNLLKTIAHYDLPSDEPIDLNNFTIELADFKKGSSIPSFCFTHKIQNTVASNVLAQRDIVSKKFTELMAISGNSSYLDLKKIYPENDKRNKIVNSLYKFVGSFGTSPATVIDEQTKESYKIQPFKKELLEQIVSPIIDKKEQRKIEKHIQLAKVEVIEGKTGKPKVLELYDKKYSQVGFAPEMIFVKNKTYELRYPLLCTMDTEDGRVVIENKMLGIYASGDTSDEAEEEFNEEFDYLFTRYNELNDAALTDDVIAIKTSLNHIVKNVK
ncbi:MAG TPA: hypothetical protein VLB84_08455 [Bacteroidia bacterium]|nr:hypothetical protein [Bacteroidia bacterium]